MRNFFVSGAWNAICDVCGMKFKSYMLKQRWDGRMVCSHDYEMRHPMDLMRVPKDDPSIEWSRPESLLSPISFIDTSTSPIHTQLGIQIFTEAGTILTVG